LSRTHDITVCLVGFEKYKAGPDLRDPSGFWLRAKAADVFPFVAAFNASPAAFHQFLIEQRVGRETRSSPLSAQIIKVEEGPTEARVLIRPNSSSYTAIGKP